MIGQRVTTTWRDGFAPLVARLSALGLLSEYVVVGGLVLVALISHGVNLFGYPSYVTIEDEGTYVADAWALLTQGTLSPYTYTYGQPPGAWILLSLWMLVTGGPTTFGEVINSGRVLVMLLDLASVVMLYHIVRRLGGGIPVAAFGAFLLAVSPLAVTYQRLVLLDNFMMFWMLASLSLVLHSKGRLSFFALAGVCFGLSALSKPTALFILPAMAFVVWRWRQEHQGKFSFVAWLVPMGLVMSWWPVYALLKGELLPANFAVRLFGRSIVLSGGQHESLLQAVAWQSNRPGGSAFDPNSQFWFNVNNIWMPMDHVLIVGGAIATVLNLARGIVDRRAFAAGLLGLFSIFYLARGSVVFQHYVLLAIPFLCINVAVLVAPIVNRLPRVLAAVVAVAAMGWLVYTYQQTDSYGPILTEQSNQAFLESVAWVKGSLPADSKIVGRDPFWADMHQPEKSGPAFPYFESHWQAGSDPAVRDGVFHDDWRNVDYVLLTPDMYQMLVDSQNTLVLAALDNSTLDRSWSANGMIVELWKVDKSGNSQGLFQIYQNNRPGDAGVPDAQHPKQPASSGSEQYPQTAPSQEK